MQTHAYSAFIKGQFCFKIGLFCYENLLSLVNSAAKENNINMVSAHDCSFKLHKHNQICTSLGTSGLVLGLVEIVSIP